MSRNSHQKYFSSNEKMSEQEFEAQKKLVSAQSKIKSQYELKKKKA